MSNYQSIIHNYGKPQSNFNQELALQALSYKQGKYDANAAKIQETLNNYGNIELARPEDREYLYERINGLINNVNGLGSADLSSTNVTSGIMGHISKALDERVIEQIGNTQKIKAFQTDVQAIKKAGKGEYADVNYQVALMKAGYVDYMNGTTDELKSLTYTPYVDVSGELTKKLKDISSVKGGKKVWQTRDGQGNILNYELDGMTESEIQSLIPNLLDSRMRGQMNVNGYYRYGGNKEAAQQNILPQYEKKIKDFDLEIANVQTKIDSGVVDTATTEKAKQQLEYLQAQKDNTQKVYNRLSEGDAGFIGGYLEEQSLTSSMAKALHAEVNQTFLADNVYFKNLEIAEKRRANDLKEQEIGGNGIPDVTSAPVAGELLDKINTYETIKAEGEKLGKDYYNNSNQFYNNLTQQQKTKVDNLSTNVKYQGLTDSEKKTQAMLDAGVLDPNAVGTLNKLGREYRNYLEDDQKIYEQTLTGALESDNFYDTLKSNNNIKILDENGRKVSYDEYFRNKGITTQEQYNSFIRDEGQSKDFKAKLISDALYSSSTKSDYSNLLRETTPQGFMLSTQNNLGHVLRGGEAGNIGKNVLLQWDRLSKITGENLKFTDAFIVESVEDTIPTALQIAAPIVGITRALIGDNKYTVKKQRVDEQFLIDHKNDFKQKYTVKINPEIQGTETYKILKGSLDAGTWDTEHLSMSDAVSMDNSVLNDSTLRSALSYDNFETEYKQKVTQSGLRLKGFSSLYINPSTGEKNKVLLFESLRAPLAAGEMLKGQDEKTFLTKLNNGVGIELSRQPDNTDNYIIKQGAKIAVIPKNVLQNYPEVMRLIDLEESEKQMVKDNTKPLKVANFNYKPDDVESYDYLSNRYGAGSPLFLASTKAGAKSVIQEANPLLTEDNGWSQTFNAALDNTNRFSAEVKNINGRNYVDVMLDGERISQISNTNIDRGQVEGIIDYDPQILVTLALRNIAIELKNQNTDNFKKLYARLNSK